MKTGFVFSVKKTCRSAEFLDFGMYIVYDITELIIMLPAFLITFREVIEATLIVATILGILVKLKQFQNIKTVWLASLSATLVSFGLLVIGSLSGLKIHELYTGKTKEIFEGIMMLVSAVFISWAVFWLHKYFAQHKLALLQKVRNTIGKDSPHSLFILVFTAVFREGFEIVLFLSTIYLTSNPVQVLSGFGLGVVMALIVSLSFFSAALKLPVFRAFQATTVLLILFAAGLAGRGVHEFAAAGLLPSFSHVTLDFMPLGGHILGDMVKSIFGWSRSMDGIQLIMYATYIAFMRQYIYGKRKLAGISEA